jgi:hypothetical protein
MSEVQVTEGDEQLRHMLLSDVDPTAISIVTKGANGQRIFLRKQGEDDPDMATLATHIVKKADGDDWSVFYIVVAEPGRAEEPGMASDDQNIRDIWASEDEIRKAAYRFMDNGALINRMHEDLEPFGKLRENAIAPCDLHIPQPDGTEQVIKSGSWYIAVEPTAEGKAAVERGEFTGVSLEGSGIRTPAEEASTTPPKPRLAKGTAAYLSDYDRELIGDMMTEPLEKAGSSASLPDLDWSAAENWIDRLPPAMGAAFKRSWIYRAAKHLTYEVYGGNRGHAFAVAIEAARKGCATGDLNWPGLQAVNAGSRAEMCAAVQLWESMKATARSQKLTKAAEAAIVAMDDPEGDGELDEKKLLRKIAEGIGFAKRAFSITQRIELAKAGKAIPVRDSAGKLVDGRYPIETVGDLRNAISAYGRGNNQAEVKSHIVKMAKHLGQIALLPDDWKELAKEAGTVEPVSEQATQTGSESKTLEQRVESLEGDLGTIKKSVEPLAALPEQLEAIAKRLPAPKEGEQTETKTEGDEPTTAELAKQLKEANEKIAKLASGESVQTGDELSAEDKDAIAKATAGGEGWEGAML